MFRISSGEPNLGWSYKPLQWNRELFIAMQKSEIILYQPDDKSIHLNVRIEGDTVWLNQAQMAELLQTTSQNITLHIGNIYKEKELTMESTCKDFLQVQIEKNRQVTRKIKHYNLDVIISVGYRVKSPRGTQFRIWATQILKEYLLKGYMISQRLESLERRVYDHDKQLESLIQQALPPSEGIFYEGQIYDAWQFVSDLIKSARESILLIDNYLDESVLTLLSKRRKNVQAKIFTKTMSAQFKLDLKKFNDQYPAIEVKIFTGSHDRFLILDQKTVYHIGASLKDLGKKWFAFSKINLDSKILISKLPDA